MSTDNSKTPKARKPTMVDAYLNEVLIIGGLPTTRGQFIKDMQAAGHPQRCIDMYLFGYDRKATR